MFFTHPKVAAPAAPAIHHLPHLWVRQLGFVGVARGQAAMDQGLLVA